MNTALYFLFLGFALGYLAGLAVAWLAVAMVKP